VESPVHPVLLSLVVLVTLAPSRPVGAEGVEIGPFAGFQFGGHFSSSLSGRVESLSASLDYGVTGDFPMVGDWHIQALYSRQSSHLVEESLGGASFDVVVERYMAGVSQQTGDGPTRFFGVALLGATRIAPGLDGYDAGTRFTMGLGLGLKHFVSKRVGIRAEARGFFTVTESGGGTLCRNGGCLFVFQGSGFVQGDLTAGVVFAF